MAEVGVLVAFCSFTFTLGNLLLGGLILLFHPELARRYVDLPDWAGRLVGVVLLSGPWLYTLGSLLHFAPLKIRGFELVYPRPPIAARQMLAGPLELIGAAGIIYFALPQAGNPGFVIVLGVFLASFTARAHQPRAGRPRRSGIFVSQGDARRAARQCARGAACIPPALSYFAVAVLARRRRRFRARADRRACAGQRRRLSDVPDHDDRRRRRALDHRHPERFCPRRGFGGPRRRFDRAASSIALSGRSPMSCHPGLAPGRPRLLRLLARRRQAVRRREDALRRASALAGTLRARRAGRGVARGARRRIRRS